MIRVELFLNRAITEPMIEKISEIPWPTKPRYTIIKDVQGTGYSGPVLGDPIWPEMNDIIILYLEDDALSPLTEAVKDIREIFPIQGLAMFILGGAQEL